MRPARTMASLLSSALGCAANSGRVGLARSGLSAQHAPLLAPRSPPAHASSTAAAALATPAAAAGPGPSSSRLAAHRQQQHVVGIHPPPPRGGRARDRRATAATAAAVAATARDVGPDLEDAGEPGPSTPPPRPTHTRVKTAEYAGSAVSLAGCPPPSVPEVALIGRSNVGKSSLINALTGRKGLAQVSKQPGKTRTINHFLVNGGTAAPWYLVDLPGYGYARAGAERRFEWASFSQTFFLERPTLAAVLLLADGSLPPQAADLECAAWLAGAGVPFAVVLTKADKRVKAKASLAAAAAMGGGGGGGAISAAAANAAALAAALADALGPGVRPPLMLATSATTGAGRNEVLAYVARVRAVAVEDGKGGEVVDQGRSTGAPAGVPDDEWY